MNAPKCRTLTTKMLLWMHTPQHKQKLSLKYHNWTTCRRSFLISSQSDSYLNLWIYEQNSTDTCSWRATRYDDGQSPRNKASKIQKSAFRCFLLTSAKVKKFQYGDWSIRLYTTISLQLRCFSKIATIVYQTDSRSFQQWVQQEAKRNILQDHKLTDRQTHTHTQTDCYNPLPTLRLKRFLYWVIAQVWPLREYPQMLDN